MLLFGGPGALYGGLAKGKKPYTPQRKKAGGLKNHQPSRFRQVI